MSKSVVYRGLCHGGPLHGEIMEAAGLLFHWCIRPETTLVSATWPPADISMLLPRIGEYRWGGNHWQYRGVRK